MTLQAISKRKLRWKSFPIICVGGSAGGLDAFIRRLQNMACDMEVAVVIVTVRS